MTLCLIVGAVGLAGMGYVALSAAFDGLSEALHRPIEEFHKLPGSQQLRLIIPFTTVVTAARLWWLLGASVGATLDMLFFRPANPAVGDLPDQALLRGFVVYGALVAAFGFWAVGYAEYHRYGTGIPGLFRKFGLFFFAAAIITLGFRADPHSDWAGQPLTIFLPQESSFLRRAF